MMDYIDLGRRICDLRHKQRLTQHALAEMAGITASYLGHIERGTRIASIDTLIALCNALHTHPNYLLAGSLASFQPVPPADTPQNEREQIARLLQHAFDVVHSRRS